MIEAVQKYIESKLAYNALTDDWDGTNSVAHLEIKSANIKADVYQEVVWSKNDPIYYLRVWDDGFTEYMHKKSQYVFADLEEIAEEYGADWTIDIERGSKKITLFHISLVDNKEIVVKGYEDTSYDLVKEIDGIYFTNNGMRFYADPGRTVEDYEENYFIERIFQDGRCNENTFAVILPYPADSEKAVTIAKKILLEYITPILQKYQAIQKALKK